MTDQLRQSFNDFCSLVIQRCGDETVSHRQDVHIEQVSNPLQQLKDMVEQCERSTEFRLLCQNTIQQFHGHLPREDHYASQQYVTCVQVFFRRTGFYHRAFQKESPDITFDDFLTAFERREKTLTYLIPLELIEFHEREYDFGWFKVKRFPKQELDAVLEQEIALQFFPLAVTNTELLSRYWWLVVKEQTEIPERDKWHIDLTSLGKVRFSANTFPDKVNEALLRLALFDWELGRNVRGKGEDLERHWSRFEAPFAIVVTDDQLERLSIAPNLNRLNLVPYVDPETREEIGELPFFDFPMGEKESEHFRSMVTEYDSMLSALANVPKRWNFLNVARSFFLKAFFSDGMEQLLWHIVVVEALVGERSEGLTEKLASRISITLEATDERRQSMRRDFKELYTFRSNMVHGNTVEDKVMVGHLRRARLYARALLVWWLRYLTKVKAATEDMDAVPKRKHLLALLETNVTDRNHLGRLSEHLPDSFPKVEGWQL